MNKLVKTHKLFKCETNYIKPLLNEEYPWQILSKIKPYIENFCKSNFSNFVEISKGVYIGSNVKIAKSAVIEQNVIIGDNCEIRQGAYIRGNVIIGNNCVIGNSCELKNSIILNNVQIPHFNYVGDSILGNYVHMGAGAICSNLKADKNNIVIHGDKEYHTQLHKVGAFLGDYVEIGCGCVLNPGTIIGRNTSVYPLISVRGVFPENSIVKDKNNIVNKI